MVSSIIWAMRRSGTRERIKALLERNKYDEHCNPDIDKMMINLLNLVQDEIHLVELAVDVEKSQEFKSERHSGLING